MKRILAVMMLAGASGPCALANIAYVNQSSAAATGTTSLSVAYPASIVPGNLLLLAVSNKYPTNGPATPTDWTLLGNAQKSGGFGSSFDDTGFVYSSVYYKVATGLESGNLSISISSGNSAIGVMFQYSISSGSAWTLSSRSASDNTVGTAWSVTTATDPNLNAGDLVFAASAFNTDNYSYSGESFTCTGCTFSGMASERFDGGTNSGQDCGLLVVDQGIGLGSSSSGITFSATSSGSGVAGPCGATVFIRLREIPGFAVITEPGETMHIAGYTWERFHGLASTSTGHEIVDWEWIYGDSSGTDYGPIVSHRYDNAGTYTVRLKTTDDAGTIAYDRFTVTTVGFSGATYYVSHVSWASDSNTGTNVAQPFATLIKGLRACYAARANGAPVRLLLDRGYQYPYPGDGGNASDRWVTPMIADAYGTGANPEIQISSGQDFFEDSGSGNWGDSVYCSNWDFTWTSSGHARVGSSAWGSVFYNCKETNGSFTSTGSNVSSKKTTWAFCEASGRDSAAGGAGMENVNGSSGPSSWTGVVFCNCHDNSISGEANAHFQGDILEIRLSQFDGGWNGNPGSHYALLLSGCHQYSIWKCEVFYATVGIGLGSKGGVNLEPEAQDLYFDSNYVHGFTDSAVELNYCNRFIIKNSAFSAGSGDGSLHVGAVAQGLKNGIQTDDQISQNGRIYNNVMYASTGADFFTHGVSNIEFKNNIVSRINPTTWGEFCNINGGTRFDPPHAPYNDYQNVTCDGNMYYSTTAADMNSSTAGTFSAASIGMTASAWFASGQDATRLYGPDPSFVSPNTGNFVLQGWSDAIDAGLTLKAVFRDFNLMLRPVGAAYDMGMNEQ